MYFTFSKTSNLYLFGQTQLPSNAYIRFRFFEVNLGTVKLDFSGRQNKRQLDFKRQNENDRFFM